MSISTEENKELCKLISINKDACSFYEVAIEETKSPTFKQTFENLCVLHSSIIANLQNQVRINGGDPEAEQTLLGQTQKFWGELMAAVSNDVDETLVAHLEEAEDRCLHSMQEAIENGDITPKTRSVLNQELFALKKSHDYMKELKEMMRAA